MFYQVNAGATGANALNAYHRRDAGIAAANNNLTGIRAARGAYIKRTDAQSAAAAAEQEASANVSANTAAAKRLPPVQKTEASGGQGIKDMKSRPGLSVALDVLESSEEGRAILAKLKASDSGIDIFYQPETGDRAFVYVGGLEKEYWEARDRITARKIAQDTADTVEISDKGRALLDGPDTSRQIYAPNMGLEGTVVRLVADVVYGKMDPTTAGKFVDEVQRLITGDSKTESVEERTVNREKGLELANYIAENYIDNPADRQKFLEGVKHFAHNAELRDKGYFVMEGPEELVRKPGQSMIPGLSPPQFLPGWQEARKAALESISHREFADINAETDAWTEETVRIFLRNAPAGKYDDLAKKYETGEMRAVDVYFALMREENETGNAEPAVSQRELDEKEREVAHIIAQTKNKLDLNAIKEEVQNMIKNILSNSAIQTGFLKGMFNQQPD